MSRIDITDELLYTYYPKIDEYELNKLPSEDEIEYEFSEIFNKKMEKLLKESKRPKIINNFYKYSKKASIIVIAFIISIFTLTMSVDALRIQLFTFIKNVYEKFTIYQLDTKEEVYIKNSKFKNIEYLPTGFKEVEKKDDEDSQFVAYTSDSEYLTFSQFKVTDSNIFIDTEGADTKEVMINNVKADYIVKKNDYKLVWKDNNNIYILTLEDLGSQSVNNKENKLIKIAENIK